MIDQTILVIDDGADLRQLASLIFKKIAAKFATTHASPRGLSKFFTHHPNLIILDEIISGQPRAGP